MRAVVIRNGRLTVDELPTPEPGPGQVLVRTLACGICGSDLHALGSFAKMAEAARASGGPEVDARLDIVMGHEFCAEVVDYGPGTARRLAPGTRICSQPVLLGANGPELIGYSMNAPGGFGEYMRLMEAALLEVPEGLSTEHAALTEPMAVGIHAVSRAHIGPDDAALIIGAGPVGLAVIAALRMRGVRPVVAADFSAKRRELAERMGADVVVDPGRDSPYASFESVAGWPDPASAPPQPPWVTVPALRPQVIFECVGVPGVLRQVMGSAAHAARIVVVGVCVEPDTIDPLIAVQKELDLHFAFGHTPEEFAATLEHIASGALPVEPMVTGTTGLAGVAGAFAELASPEKHAKVLVEPWRA